tara:strand:+ start:513 stop:809 length:297 start_codon:yes stop_codon:yes gene_type:complete
MSLPIKPKQDRIIIELIKGADKTESGIIIPESAKELPNQAKVLAVGPGRYIPTTDKYAKPDVTVGDTVLFTKYSGTEVEVANEKYLIIKENDIIATIV